VGQVGGQLGEGRVVSLDASEVTLDVTWTALPPAPSSITVVLALPRPKALKRIFGSLCELGIKRLCLINAYRVEKSFWQSPFLEPEFRVALCQLGLEQARDTVLPDIQLRPQFKPFVEDELPGWVRNTRALLADPMATAPCPCAVPGPVTLVLGPEGGFIPFELDLLRNQGLEPVSLGTRILRVETAVSALVGRLLDVRCTYRPATGHTSWRRGAPAEPLFAG